MSLFFCSTGKDFFLDGNISYHKEIHSDKNLCNETVHSENWDNLTHHTHSVTHTYTQHIIFLNIINQNYIIIFKLTYFCLSK